ncbi:MAG: cysteine--tRNA ligase, partial [Stagnimonas sp.]|nr:cysteine--tRNA ligase [Stagnimonas sp.]
MQLFNTLAGRKEEFTPIDPARVTMYVCGPTVYSYAHIGNARPAVVFDTLARVLRRRFAHVVYVRNITDIDD